MAGFYRLSRSRDVLYDLCTDDSGESTLTYWKPAKGGVLCKLTVQH